MVLLSLVCQWKTTTKVINKFMLSYITVKRDITEWVNFDHVCATKVTERGNIPKVNWQKSSTDESQPQDIFG